MNLDDTIVAISSPPGPGYRGIVRISGPQALQIAQTVFATDDGRELSTITENIRLSGMVRIDQSRLPASAILFRAPRSYTRQDLVELHLLGAPIILSLITESCFTAGARHAEPGEFTARAFLAGALDLSQVHGIAGMIAARSDMQLQAAARLLHGHLARTAGQAREELADLLSLVEGALDFADEPIEFITPDELRRRLNEVRSILNATASAGFRAERWNELPRVLLVGRPNVGKSSLLNQLSGMDRAICTPIAGTTRDEITAPLILDGLECLLVDVAGLDEALDDLDAKAQATARAAMRDADLLLHVIDATTLKPDSTAQPDGDAFLTNFAPPDKRSIVVLNKCDLLASADRKQLEDTLSSDGQTSPILVSAATREGLAELKSLINDALHDRHIDARDDVIALMTEHRDALVQAIDAIGRAVDLAVSSGEGLADADLVAAELHTAAEALGRLVGREDTEALLGRIFSRFCVGK